MYGTHSELSKRNIDTVQLLGLIKNERNEQDVFAYKDCIDEESDSELEFQRMISVEGPESPSLHRRKQIHKSSESDETSLHSAPSMLSLDSEVGASRHESEVCMHVYCIVCVN